MHPENLRLLQGLAPDAALPASLLGRMPSTPGNGLLLGLGGGKEGGGGRRRSAAAEEVQPKPPESSASSSVSVDTGSACAAMRAEVRRCFGWADVKAAPPCARR